MQTFLLILMSIFLIFCGNHAASFPVNFEEADSLDSLPVLSNIKADSVWGRIPVIEPPNSTIALATARLKILASVRGTYLDPFNLTSNYAKNRARAAAVTNVVCETSRYSPDWVDALALAIWVKARGNINCPQLKDRICTTVSQWGTAGIGICSTPGMYKLNCFTVGGSARFIVDDCIRVIDGVRRVGGKYIFDYAPAYDSVINLFRNDLP